MRHRRAEKLQLEKFPPFVLFKIKKKRKMLRLAVIYGAHLLTQSHLGQARLNTLGFHSVKSE